MADLSITRQDVGVAASSSTEVAAVVTSVVQVGEAVNQGQPVYLDTASNKYMLCRNDAEATSLVLGVALTTAATNGYVVIMTAGIMDVGATLAVGVSYYVSGTYGGIMPAADLSTGVYVSRIGTAVAASRLELGIKAYSTAYA